MQKNEKSAIELFSQYFKPNFEAHSLNVAKYAVYMWKILVDNGNLDLMKFTEQEIYIACALHDIGKCFVPEDILNKNGPLDTAERDVIETHPQLGQQTIGSFELPQNSINSLVPFELVNNVVFCHHERWDGKGYPYGIKGDRIPVVARLCAIADTYDAITSDRPYRKGAPSNKALEVLIDVSGSQLDKNLVTPLLANVSWTEAVNPCLTT